jgi:hypothetical protein
MRERTLERAPADTATPQTPAMRKRRCTSTSLCSTHPAPRVARKEFWTARMKAIPSFRCDPWDFYEPFLKLGSGPSLVLCNSGAEIRVMRTSGIASECDEVYCFPEIQHPNFVNIHECYLFEDEIFILTEHVGFSIEDLLFHSIYPTEREIAYVISQVSRILPFPARPFVNIAGLGWHTIHLVQETRSSTYINREYSRVFQRRGQDR